MDMTIISEYKAGAIELKNKQLRKSTDVILKNMKNSKDAYCKAALELRKIRDEKLFKDDFFENGKPSFSRYCEEILGISKSAASRIIKVGVQMLAPELMGEEKKPEYFTNFGDTNLSIIAEVSENYDECQQFCIDYEIDETTAQKDVRAAVKDYKEKHKPSKEVEADGEIKDEETANAKISARELKEKIGEFARSDLNALVQKYPDYAGIITRVAEEW